MPELCRAAVYKTGLYERGDMNIVKVLKRCEVFVGLDDPAIERIASLPWRMDRYNKDDFIFHEGSAAQNFYILDEGEIRLVAAMRREGIEEPAAVSVDTVTKGDVFGWSSLVAPHFLVLSAVCVKPSVVAAVRGTELWRFMDANPVLGYEIMKGLIRVVGRRVRDLHRKLAGKNLLALRTESPA